MERNEIKKGDRLPNSLLTDSEWNYLKELFDNEPKPFSKEFIAEIEDLFMAYNKEKEMAVNDDVCVLCGEGKRNGKFVCLTCERAIRYRNSLRCFGKSRKFSYAKTVCECCGENYPISYGLCKRCYSTKKYHGFETLEELRNHILKKSPDKNEVYTDFQDFLTKVR